MNNTFIGHVRSNLITNGTVPARPSFAPAPRPTEVGTYIQMGGVNTTSPLDIFNDVNIVWTGSPSPVPPIMDTTINGLNSLARNGQFPNDTNYVINFTYIASSGRFISGSIITPSGNVQLWVYPYNNPNSTIPDSQAGSYLNNGGDPVVPPILMAPISVPGVCFGFGDTYPNFCVSTPTGNQPVTGTCPRSTLSRPVAYLGPLAQERSVMLLKLVSWLQCSNEQFEMGELTLDIDIEIIITTNCANENLVETNNICYDFCSQPTNQDTCLPLYLNHCFSVIDGQEHIYTDQGCRTFLQNYISKLGPNANIDNNLQKYCRNKYPSLVGLSQSGDQVDIPLCACNMEEQNYEDLAAALSKALGLSTVTSFGIPAPCLWGSCAGSPFKTNTTGKPCPVPQCLNIADVNVNGTLGGDVNIRQTADCVNAQIRSGGISTGTGNGTGNGTGEPSFFDKYRWYILGIGIAIVILIIIIIVIAI
jgi:hypothetical protein